MTASRAAAVLVLAFALAACATSAPPQDAPPTPAPDAVAAEPAAKTDTPPTPAPTPAVAPKPRVYWAVRMLPGPKWVAGKPPNEQPGIDEHVDNMEKWNERGLLFVGGPYLDGTGGMAVLRVKTAKEAKDLADADPGVRSGLLVPEIHPWLCVFRTGD